MASMLRMISDLIPRQVDLGLVPDGPRGPRVRLAPARIIRPTEGNMEVIVQNGNIERALRELKKKLGRDRTAVHLRIRNDNPAPSERRKAKAHEAAKVRRRIVRRREMIRAQRERARLRAQRDGDRQAKVRYFPLPQRAGQFRRAANLEQP